MKAVSKAKPIKPSARKREKPLSTGVVLYKQAEKSPLMVEENGDAAWEQTIANPKARPKLGAAVAKIRTEMKSGKHFPPMRVEDM